jgi:dipeptidyl aminopeptidase/acylaminoacyl peptidase
LSATTASQATEPTGALTFELLLQLRRPREVELSPNGGRVAFTVAPVAKERGQGLETRLWVGDVDGAAVPLGDPGATDGTPRFSPDGAVLAYASDRGHAGRMSLWLEGRSELGTMPGSVEDIRWSPDGRSLLVLAADLGSDRAGAQTATKIQEAGAGEQDPKVLRPARFWRRLFHVDAATGDTREVSPPGVNVWELDWAGDKAVAVCSEDPTEGGWYGAWIGLIDIGTRRVERVYEPKWQLQCPVISPQGRVAWIEGMASDRSVVTGTVSVLGSGPLAPQLDATWLAFADEETLWFAGWRQSGSLFGRLDLDGTVAELAGGDVLIGYRHQPRVSPSADGTRVAAVRESADDAPEVVLFEGGEVRALTSLNHELAPHLKVANWSRTTWASTDGLEIEGILAVPRGATGPLPCVVEVHGGPTGTWAWAVHAHGLLFAQAGYAVFYPNPRGSTGQGPAFQEANFGDMGGLDLQDILTGVDALVRDGVVDGARVGITGGSYGGFMSSWAVTQSDLFAASVPYAVVTNWVSFHNTTNIPQWDRLYIDDDPYDPSGEYVKRSPVYHAAKCKTPTLILHGEEDLCTPLPQAYEFYHALVEAGCEVELVVYPREGHGWLEREHQIDGWRRTRDWFDRYLRA